MEAILKKYLPERAVLRVMELIKLNNVYLKIVNERQTKHGDYRRLVNGQHQITVNNSLNKYAFLITLVHEIAHLVAFEKFGYRIKPHGKEWKYTFKVLMLPFITPDVFPESLIGVVANHFKNPRAASETDPQLSIALRRFDDNAHEIIYIHQLLEGTKFRISNGQCFVKGKKRVKRYECIEIDTGKNYLFQPTAQVEPLV